MQRALNFDEDKTILIDVVEEFPSSISLYDLDGNLLYTNSLYKKEHSYKTISHAMDFKVILEALDAKSSYEIEHKENEKWYRFLFFKVKECYIVQKCSDITQQKESEMSLKQSAVFFENTSEGIVITNAKGIIRSVNSAFSKITGYSKEEVLGKTPAILNSGVHPKYFYEQMWQHLDAEGQWCGEIWNRRKNAEVYLEWLSISKVYNPQCEEMYYIAIFSDISKITQADEKIHYLANYDSLTGLANRAQLEEHLKTSLENVDKTENKTALLFVDIDKFKEVNDTHGHQLGDEMLKIVSSRMKTALRSDDFIARIGGDEFVIVLNDVAEDEDVLNIAKKMNEKIQEVIQIQEQHFFMTLSIGIALYPDDAKNINDLIKNADAAMYTIKENGRNGAMLYSTEMTEIVSHKLNMHSQLQSALQLDQFVMVYQGVVDFKDNSIVGAEALVRWNHPTKGVLTPNEFLSFIDDSSMSISFGYLIIEKVAKDLCAINKKLWQKEFKVSINLNAQQFFEPELLHYLLKICKKYELDPRQIELELLETSIINQRSTVQIKFDSLKHEGFSIAIDDFGTGYSSLSYLKDFHVDKLKIDKSFIRDCLSDSSDRALIEAIINLSSIFSLKAQAEGIESLEQHELMVSLGCDYGQGYYYNKPLVLECFLDFYEGDKGIKSLDYANVT